MTDPSSLTPHPSSLPTPPSPLKTFFKTPRGKMVVIIGCVVILLFVAFSQVYSRPMDDPFVRVMANIIPFPAVVVDGTSVSLKDFLAEYNALEQYFEEQGSEGPNSDDLEIAIADTIINKLVIRKLAAQRGIVVDEESVEQYYQDVIASEESEEAFVKELDESFGWSVEDFRTKVVESIVLALQMNDEVLNNAEDQMQRREAIDGAYARLRNGEDFATVAKDIHSGFDAAFESDLGYVSQSIIPSTWVSAVENLPEDSYTEVLELPEGFAIFKVEERIVAGDDTQLHLLVVSVPKKTLEEVVGEYLEGAKVKRNVGGN
jgi:parvulin-like peptidyl-prolyl isomerase